VTSAVRVEWDGRGTGFRLRFGGGKRAAAFSGQTADFEDAEGIGSGRMDVQGGCGVHGVASLCGGESQKLTLKVILRKKKYQWGDVLWFFDGADMEHPL
jgi:hypothetical protein